MAISLLEADGAERLRARINGDPEFRLISRDMALHLAIQVDDDARLMKFQAGTLTSIARFVPLTEPIDITIRGPAAFWAKLLLPVPPPRFQNLYAAVRAGTCEVIGDSELYNAYFAALTRMIDLMRIIENGQAPR